MIGHVELVDRNDVCTFNFVRSPIEVLDDVIGWAESICDKRTRAYGEFYPWRNRTV